MKDRILMMTAGILLIGLCVAAFRLSVCGVDPFTCMNLGISGVLPMSFGTWQLIMNSCLLVAVFFLARHSIGPGTILNMVSVGYIADFLCWLVQTKMQINLNLPMRGIMLCLGMLFASAGVALYMTADLGVAPYDSVASIIKKYSGSRISFRAARVLSDVTVMLVGLGFGIAGHENLWELFGIGTICNSLLNGPLIQFFQGCIFRKMKESGRMIETDQAEGISF